MEVRIVPILPVLGRIVCRSRTLQERQVMPTMAGPVLARTWRDTMMFADKAAKGWTGREVDIYVVAEPWLDGELPGILEGRVPARIGGPTGAA